jgi:broad specificity phosphatase PhoE
MRTFLIRHAETVWNSASRIQGQADPPLSERGEQQCAALADRLQAIPLARVYTSDLERARRTADAVAAAHEEVEVVPHPGLREVALGRWEGATAETLSTEWPDIFARWVESPSWDLVPGGEGEKPFADRVAATMTEILEASGDGDTVAVVTHIGVIRQLLSVVTGAPVADMRWRWAIDNTSLTRLDSRPDFEAWAGGDVELLAVNDNAHVRTMPR